MPAIKGFETLKKPARGEDLRPESRAACLSGDQGMIVLVVDEDRRARRRAQAPPTEQLFWVDLGPRWTSASAPSAAVCRAGDGRRHSGRPWSNEAWFSHRLRGDRRVRAAAGGTSSPARPPAYMKP